MTAFCLDTVVIDAQLCADRGLLRAASLAATANARMLAQRIAAKAQTDADRLAQEARAEAQHVASRTEQDTLRRADELIRQLEQAQVRMLERAHDTIVDLACALFDRLVADSTPRERIEATLRLLLQEAPPKLVNPVLRVHPGETALVPEVEWEIKPDATLPRGTCRLEASSGEWCVDFNAAVEALRLAFACAVEEPSADDVAHRDDREQNDTGLGLSSQETQ